MGGGPENFSASKLREGAKFQCKQIEGAKLSRGGGGENIVHDYRGGQNLNASDPPPVNNDRSLRAAGLKGLDRLNRE